MTETTADSLTDDPNWHPSLPLSCDIPNLKIEPGVLVRIAATQWGIPCGNAQTLDSKYTLNIGNYRAVEPRHLPIGVVVARSCEVTGKGRHIVCVFISRERRFLWFKVADVIGIAEHGVGEAR